VENSPMLTSRGLGRVLGDLTSMGFDARWGVLGAADVGAPHQRDRIWIVAKWRGQLPHAQHDRIGRWEQQQESIEETTSNVANPQSSYGWGRKFITEDKTIRTQGADQFSGCGKNVADTASFRQQRQGQYEQPIHPTQGNDWQADYVESIGRPEQWSVEPNVGRVANGVAARVDRLKAIGNGQVPLCAATAWHLLSK
jgi:DNA (cytosine-5)-methyltransferase 1